MIILYEFHLDKDDNVRHVCQTQKGSIKKKQKPTKKRKYGIEVPHNIDGN